MWSQQMSHGTMVSTYRIIRFSFISERDFIRVMREEIMAAIPAVDTGAIFIGWQELVKDETDNPLDQDTYLWAIHWHGFHRPALVKKESERLYDGVRDKVFSIGIRTSLTVATPPKERCIMRDGHWVTRF